MDATRPTPTYSRATQIPAAVKAGKPTGTSTTTSTRSQLSKAFLYQVSQKLKELQRMMDEDLETLARHEQELWELQLQQQQARNTTKKSWFKRFFYT